MITYPLTSIKRIIVEMENSSESELPTVQRWISELKSMTWQPISTAPRDGRTLILRGPTMIEKEGCWKFRWIDWKGELCSQTEWIPKSC